MPTRGLISVLERISYDPRIGDKLFREGITMIKTYKEWPFQGTNIWADRGYNLAYFVRNNQIVAHEVAGYMNDGGYCLSITMPHYRDCDHVGDDSFIVVLDRKDFDSVDPESGEEVGMNPHDLAISVLYEQGGEMLKKLSVYPPEADSGEWASYAPFQRAGFLVI